MENFNFWEKWSKPDAAIYKILLFVFFVSGTAYVALHYTGIDLAYDWQILNNIKPLQVPVKEVNFGIFDFFVEGVNYLNLQEFAGIPSGAYERGAVILVGLFFICLAVILTVSTYMSRFWFFVLMGLMIFLLHSLRLENLELFGKPDRTAFILALILFIGPAYYFHAIRENVPAIHRLLTMLSASLVLILLVVFFAATEKPLLAFAGYALIPPVIIAVLFIIIVAHDIVSFFLYIITNNNNEYSKNSDIHFAAITILYLLLLLFTHLYNTRVISWSLIYLDPFLILLISAFLGIWGLKHRSGFYNKILRFEPYGALLYLSMGIICFATIAWFFASANDPIIESFEDIILFTHLGYGIAFFVYVLANFFTLLHHNQKVYRVVYKPIRMPYFTAQLAGFIAALAFFFQSGQASLHQAKSGYYNGIAGYYQSTGNNELAKHYYRQGAIFGYNNHHSNFGLASVFLKENDAENAVYFFHQATRKKPTEYAFVNLSSVYNLNDSYFESLFALQDGLKAFPGSGPIANNLALRYNKINTIDSALFYIEMAKRNVHAAAVANEFGIYATNGVYPEADTLRYMYRENDNLELRTHLLALLNRLNEDLDVQGVHPSMHDTLLNINGYAFLQNYIVNQLDRLDTADLRSLPALIENGGGFFEPSLTVAQALGNYENGMVYNALDQLLKLWQESTGNKDYYAAMLASIALNEWEPAVALQYLQETYHEQADSAGRIDGLMAIAGLAMNDRDLIDSASFALQDVHPFSAMREAMKKPFPQGLSDSARFFYVVLNRDVLSVDDEMEVVKNFTQEELTAATLAFLIQIYLEQKDTALAARYVDLLKALPQHGKEVFIRGAELKMLYLDGHLDRLFEEYLGEPGGSECERLLYEALHDKSRGMEEEAKSKFHRLAGMNPFFEEGVIEAAKYLEVDEDELLSYRILLRAINYNDYSPELYQAYIVRAIETGLTSYADDAMVRLQELLDPADFRAFKDRTETLKRQLATEW